MPAKSEAQRRYLAAKFGPGWLHRHHFDNPGPLPARAKPTLLDKVAGSKKGKR